MHPIKIFIWAASLCSFAHASPAVQSRQDSTLKTWLHGFNIDDYKHLLTPTQLYRLHENLCSGDDHDARFCDGGDGVALPLRCDAHSDGPMYCCQDCEDHVKDVFHNP